MFLEHSIKLICLRKKIQFFFCITVFLSYICTDQWHIFVHKTHELSLNIMSNMLPYMGKFMYTYICPYKRLKSMCCISGRSTCIQIANHMYFCSSCSFDQINNHNTNRFHDKKHQHTNALGKHIINRYCGKQLRRYVSFMKVEQCIV